MQWTSSSYQISVYLKYKVETYTRCNGHQESVNWNTNDSAMHLQKYTCAEHYLRYWTNHIGTNPNLTSKVTILQEPTGCPILHCHHMVPVVWLGGFTPTHSAELMYWHPLGMVQCIPSCRNWYGTVLEYQSSKSHHQSTVLINDADTACLKSKKLTRDHCWPYLAWLTCMLLTLAHLLIPMI